MRIYCVKSHQPVEERGKAVSKVMSVYLCIQIYWDPKRLKAFLVEGIFVSLILALASLLFFICAFLDRKYLKSLILSIIGSFRKD